METPPIDEDGCAIIDGRKNGYCDDVDRFETLYRLSLSVPKNTHVSPYFCIICSYCGSDMEKDLHCPSCGCEVRGELVINQCDFCGCGVTELHTPETCPDRDAPTFFAHLMDTDEDEPLTAADEEDPSTWMPSSPVYSPQS